MKNKSNFLIQVGLSVTLMTVTLSGCQLFSNKSIQPGSEKIRILDAEPKGCLFMGEVSSVQDNDNVVYKGGEVEMSLNTRIDLRNKAFAQNANILVFTPKQKTKIATAMPPAVIEPKKDAKSADGKAPEPPPPPPPTPEPAKSTDTKPDETVFLGTVFRCPPQIFNQ